MEQGVKNKIEHILQKYTEEKEYLLHIRQLLDEIEWQNNAIRESASIADLVAENLQHLAEGNIAGRLIKTGFTDFDRCFGGLALGEFVVIGARPAVGKSLLLVNLCLNISAAHPVLFFTYDLSARELTSRLISCLSGIDLNHRPQADLTEEQKGHIYKAARALEERPILVNDSGNHAMSALRAHCRKEIEESGVKVIIVDYLQMMSSHRYRNSRELEISYISRELKNLARDFNVCVIATSQLSRAVEMRGGDRRPLLPDLRDSGAIEQDADKVIFMYRPEYYGFHSDQDGNNTDGITELIMAKNRTGVLDVVRLMRDIHATRFSDFKGYKNEFSFSKSRLDELDAPF
jgi:replicative DNA helicase